MDAKLIGNVLEHLNALIASEVASPAPGHYERAMKLSAYADRIQKMTGKRVADVTQGDRHHHHRHPMLGGVPYWRNPEPEPDAADLQVDAVIEAANGAGEDALGPRYLGGLGFQNIVGGGAMQGPADMADVVREMAMTQRNILDESKKPKPRSPAQLARDLTDLLDTRKQLEGLPENDLARYALPGIRDNITAIVTALEATRTEIVPARKPNPEPKGSDRDLPANSALADSQLLRRHPPHLDVPEDVRALGGETDAPRTPGAGDPRAQGPEQGLDRGDDSVPGG